MHSHVIITPMTTKAKTATAIMLENGGNVSKAMREAGYSETTAKNPQKFKARPEVQNELQRLLKKKGITLDKALEPIAKGLEAKTRHRVGEVIEDNGDESNSVHYIYEDRDNIPLQLQASDRALKLLNIAQDNPSPTSLAGLQQAIEDNVDEVQLVSMTFRQSPDPKV